MFKRKGRGAGRPAGKYQDGILMPEYWRCILCRQPAQVPLRSTLFRMAVANGCFPDSAAAAAAGELVAADLSGDHEGYQALLAADPSLEDTSGLFPVGAGGSLAECVFLCSAHHGQVVFEPYR